MAKDKSNTSGKGREQASAPTGLGGKVAELKDFFQESQAEMKKVVWPTRKETIAMCGAVLVVTMVIALYLGIVDLAFSKLIEAILS